MVTITSWGRGNEAKNFFYSNQSQKCLKSRLPAPVILVNFVSSASTSTLERSPIQACPITRTVLPIFVIPHGVGGELLVLLLQLPVDVADHTQVRIPGTVFKLRSQVRIPGTVFTLRSGYLRHYSRSGQDIWDCIHIQVRIPETVFTLRSGYLCQYSYSGQDTETVFTLRSGYLGQYSHYSFQTFF